MEQESTESDASSQSLSANAEQSEGRQAVDDADTDELWSNPLVAYPGGRRQRIVRIDEDIFDWFLDRGLDFELQINEALRNYIKSFQ